MDYYAVVMTHSTAMDSVFIRTRIFMFSNFTHFAFSYFICMINHILQVISLHSNKGKGVKCDSGVKYPEVQTDHSETAELSKPQLRMSISTY